MINDLEHSATARGQEVNYKELEYRAQELQCMVMVVVVENRLISLFSITYSLDKCIVTRCEEIGRYGVVVMTSHHMLADSVYSPYSISRSRTIYWARRSRIFDSSSQ